MLESILENFGDDQDVLIADGFDAAVIGIDLGSGRLIYSVKRCLRILMDEDMDYIDAIEHFDYNVRGSYVGDLTPIWCEDNFM